MPSQLAAASPAPIADLQALLSRDNPAILTVAHRGVWTSAPENSRAAIRAAIALGVEIVEIDTQATADGRLVVIHDATLDRTTTQSGTVRELDSAIVAKARLKMGGGGPDAAVTAECVPGLEDILEEARGRIAVNIDTKFPRDLPLVATTVRRLRMEREVIVKTDVDPASGVFPVLKADWFGHVPHMPMFRIRPGRFTEDLRAIAPLQAPMIEVRFDDVADIAAARDELARRDIRVWINTLDVSHCLDLSDGRAATEPDSVWGVLAEAGVGAVQTDSAAGFKAWLAGRHFRRSGAAPDDGSRSGMVGEAGLEPAKA